MIGSKIISADSDAVASMDEDGSEPYVKPKPKIAVQPTTVVCDENREYVINRFEHNRYKAIEVGVDCETNTGNPKQPNAMRDDLVGVGVSLYDSDDGDHIETFYGDRTTPWYRDLLADFLPSIPYYAHNALYDTTVLRRNGISLGPLIGDGRIAAYLLGQPEAGLKPLLEEWFGIDVMEFTELLDRHGVKRISDVPIEAVAEYCGSQDAQLCVPLARAMAAQLSDRVRAVYEKVELPMVKILCDMTMKGITFNREKAIPMLDQATANRDGLDKVIAGLIRSTGFTQYEMKDGIPYARTCQGCRNGSKKRSTCEQCKGAGRQPIRFVDFNAGSSKQVRSWLYDHMKFPMRRYAGDVKDWMIEKGIVEAEELEGSTDALALLQLQERHPAIPVMLTRRHFQKDVGFLRGWIGASEKDGRIHSQFTNTTVASGRLSSFDPNLQQVQLKFRVLFEAD